LLLCSPISHGATSDDASDNLRPRRLSSTIQLQVQLQLQLRLNDNANSIEGYLEASGTMPVRHALQV
jgi:hypothetical protein